MGTFYYLLLEFFLCYQLQMPKTDILQHFLQNRHSITFSGQQGITCRLLLKKKALYFKQCAYVCFYVWVYT